MERVVIPYRFRPAVIKMKMGEDGAAVTTIKEIRIDSMDIFSCIPQLLGQGEDSVLAVIVSRSGSAPRAVGTRMIVRSDGSIMGTIGGGILEAQVMNIAKEIFRDKKSVLRNFVFSAKDAASMGMICGGQVKVLLQFLDASNPFCMDLYRQIHETLRSRKRAWLVTEISSGDGGVPAELPSLVRNNAAQPGALDPNTIQALIAGAPANPSGTVSHGDKQFLIESLCHEGAVYIFGAGHISRELAPLTTQVGFQTIVLDDRADFANRHRFQTADEIIVLDSFDRAMEGLEINEESYLVLVTRGHAHDKTVLKQALQTNAGYIGMIGSRRKRDAIYDALCKEGLPRAELDRVYSPIGLDIGAETPEEIAVSIVAQLIHVRAGRSK
jgi:xanthine dehydrogenase accessory factor